MIKAFVLTQRQGSNLNCPN